ncbi:MFS transporter [Qipengyuania marisflavi]|uniref:MFS transporter n=1 Tax=Qipengyuania marisflavi TaxID=2486356 RepID=A0A5S3P8P3_9SPHN|nr:MFS transporter [Qipengyuania marisflavi]TMM49869.1 MFS transporter [Qipengyuania marisflavi]
MRRRVTIPAAPSPAGTEPTSPLVIPDFRRFWTARFIAVAATLSMVVLIGYQAYDLARSDYGYSRSEGAFLLGLLGLAQFIPLFVLTPVAGWAADRFDRRHVAAMGNLTDCTITIALTVMTYLGALTLPILFALAALHGGARVFLGPAMSSIAPNIVPLRLLPRAIALSSIAWQGATVMGPAVGGFLFAEAQWLPHALSAALLIGSAALILSIRPIRAEQDAEPKHPVRQMVEGAQYTWRQRFLLGCVTLDLLAVLLGGATAMLPVFARDILMVGPEGLGIMRGAPALGASVVAAWMAWRPLERKVGSKMLWSVVGFGAATIGFGLSRDYTVSIIMLVLLGAFDMISVFIRSSLVQLNTPDRMRGRVSSISGLAISASNELGEMQSGLAAAFLGAAGAVVFGGAGAILVTAIWAVLFPQLRQADTFAPEFLDESPKEASP